MSNDLELYHQILFIDRPWMGSETTDAKYQQLLHEVSKENFAQQPLYEISFLKPLTPKRKYYHAIISNEAIAFINSVHTLIKRALNDNERKYHIHTILSKKLPAKLRETQKIIALRKLYFSLIDDNTIDKKLRDNAYIIQYLKYRLIALYLEIQNSFPAWLKEDNLTEQDIHSLYFDEDLAGKIFIGKAQDLGLPKATDTKLITKEEKKFNPIKGDFRDAKKRILSYTDLIAKPDKFAVFEIELFEQGLIDEHYNFKKEYGQIQELAAAFRILIRKGYLNKYYFPGHKEISERQISSFLNHRYNANIDREFRNFKEKTRFEDYLEKKPWLMLILPS
jgi:hypothetical protein